MHLGRSLVSLSSVVLQEAEPTLASTLHSTVLVHKSFEKTMAFMLANKLASTTLLGTHLMRLCQDAFEDDPVGLSWMGQYWLCALSEI